jgi:hypothetical protein
MNHKRFKLTIYFCIVSIFCHAQILINFFDIGYDVTTDSLKKLGFENMTIPIRVTDTLLSLSGGNKEATAMFEVVSDEYEPNYGKIVAKTVIVKNVNDSLEAFFSKGFEVLTKPNDECEYFLVRYKYNNHLYVCNTSKHFLFMITLYPLKSPLKYLNTFPDLNKQ